ncbi:hypothetical protein H8D85_01420 [bacterium]|nr:hypothetical protein [bacterium]
MASSLKDRIVKAVINKKNQERAAGAVKTGLAAYGSYKIAEKVPGVNRVTDLINEGASNALEGTKNMYSAGKEKITGIFKKDGEISDAEIKNSKKKGVFSFFNKPK